MHFGEYELSPGLIGLSLLPSPHPEAFQRLLVRPSIRRYPDFSLDKGRSPGFASATADYKRPVRTRFRCGPAHHCARPRRRRQLVGSLCKRHAVTAIGSSDRLKAYGFRVSFIPLFGVLFTFPSRYWFAIGLSRVFSLGGWARRIHTGLLVSRATQGTAGLRERYAYGPFTLCGAAVRLLPLRSLLPSRGPTTPCRPGPARFGLLPGRSPLLGESLLFSLPAGTKMFQFPALASRSCGMAGRKPAGFSHSDTPVSKAMCASAGFFAACHVLRRLREPGHPPYALPYSVLRLAAD